ncbi:hypothetical protein MIR68_002025 [Amoeboaphelidium protococcarum]|nr:hypothetical protein MIR68_002025 [Amoeboaphelidium protococcarum]
MLSRKVWRIIEDTRLCRAWVHASNDPINGTDKDSSIYMIWFTSLGLNVLKKMVLKTEEVLHVRYDVCSIKQSNMAFLSRHRSKPVWKLSIHMAIAISELS